MKMFRDSGEARSDVVLRSIKTRRIAERVMIDKELAWQGLVEPPKRTVDGMGLEPKEAEGKKLFVPDAHIVTVRSQCFAPPSVSHELLIRAFRGSGHTHDTGFGMRRGSYLHGRTNAGPRPGRI